MHSLSRFKNFILPALLMIASSVFVLNMNIPVFRNPDKIIYANPAQPEFIISVPANRTTGYRWILKPYDQRMLMLVSTAYQRPISQLAGAGGNMNYTFRATDSAFQQLPTSTQITLVYARPWEIQTPAKIKVFTVTNALSMAGHK